MRVIVAGTRTIRDYQRVVAMIESSPWFGRISRVLCGASKEEYDRYKRGKFPANVDLLGADWAYAHGIPVDHYEAYWERFGKSAGPIRNGEMARDGEALILVWNGTSTGSLDMLTKAKAAGLPVWPMDMEAT